MKPLSPDMLKYQGWFRLPDKRGRPAQERYGHGGHGLCFNPENESLFVAAHEHYDSVGEVRVPAIGGRAEELREPFDPAPFRTLTERKRLDTLGGLELEGDGSVLYSTWFAFYGVQPTAELDTATLAAFDLEENRPVVDYLGIIGPQKEPFSQKAHSGYMFRLPYDWTEANGIEGQVLGCGRGDGAGNATSPKGPALFAVDPLEPENATVLLYRGQGQEPPGWTPCDRWHGGAWIRAGEYEAVVFVGEVAVEPTWYGTPHMTDERPEWFWTTFTDWRAAWREREIWDRWRAPYPSDYTKEGGSRGYHTTRREVRLQAYDTHVLASVVQNVLSPEVEASWTHTLDIFHEAAQPGAMAYDEKGRRLFVWESFPPEQQGTTYTGEDPRIHVWKVEVPEDEPEEPERERITVQVLIDGERYAGDLERDDL